MHVDSLYCPDAKCLHASMLCGYTLVRTCLQTCPNTFAGVNVHFYMLHCNNKSIDISVYVQSKVICMLLMCQKSLSIPLADYGRINLQCFLTSRYFVHSVSTLYTSWFNTLGTMHSCTGSLIRRSTSSVIVISSS